MRYFVGVKAPENVIAKAGALQAELAKLPMRCKMVEGENIHICLSFLGDLDEKGAEFVKTGLDKVAAGFEKFDVVVDGAKPIPKPSYIRVIVLGVNDEGGKIESLRKAIVAQVGGDSKPPHVTLCRVRHIEDKAQILKKIEELSCDEAFPVESIQLIKSELRKSGPVYTVVHESKLINSS